MDDGYGIALGGEVGGWLGWAGWWWPVAGVPLAYLGAAALPEKQSYVAEAERAVSAAGHVVVDMADFPAAGQPAARLCAERVRGCDVYVGVLQC